MPDIENVLFAEAAHVSFQEGGFWGWTRVAHGRVLVDSETGYAIGGLPGRSISFRESETASGSRPLATNCFRIGHMGTILMGTARFCAQLA